jgi:phage virion morphogenesis protein
MSGFSVTVDDASFKGALNDLSGRLKSLREPMASIGQAIVTASDLSFRAQKDPWGVAWAKLRASTLRQRRKGKRKGRSDQILRDTGRLQNSISYRANRDSVTVGTNVVYAAIHQFGGTIQHPGGKRTLYFKTNKAGTEVGNRFVKRGQSNFAQDADVGPYSIRIPTRAFLPIRPGGQVDLPKGLLDDLLDIARDHLAEASR